LLHGPGVVPVPVPFSKASYASLAKQLHVFHVWVFVRSRRVGVITRTVRRKEFVTSEGRYCDINRSPVVVWIFHRKRATTAGFC
jgi:hypothetical protein